LDRTLALKDCAFDIAEISGKMRKKEREDCRENYPEKDLLKASPQDNRTKIWDPGSPAVWRSAGQLGQLRIPLSTTTDS